ncbi:MAG: hypothetical protein FJW39_15125 [Acidobacteria bacterium]|nr:hypothetical protein [Acidobacteriota bacterium]
MNWRWVPAAALLLFQMGAILYARTVPSRYFCWAPFDMQTEYTADVTVNGRELTAREIQQRYRRPKKGVDNRSVQHVIDMFEQTERRYHGGDDTRITLRYRVNGHRPGEWQWPPR